MFDFLSGDWLAIGIFAVVGLLGWGLTGAVVGLLVAAGLLLGARLVGIVIGVPIHLLFAWLKPDAYAAWRYNQVRKYPEDFSADEVAEGFRRAGTRDHKPDAVSIDRHRSADRNASRISGYVSLST